MTDRDPVPDQQRRASIAEEMEVEMALHADTLQNMGAFRWTLRRALKELKRLDWIPLEKQLPQIPDGQNAIAVEFIDIHGVQRDATYMHDEFHELLIPAGAEWRPALIPPVKWRYRIRDKTVR